jgi:phage FluMu gp28-like protein
MAKPSEGGQNYFYIGDTKDKAREFIGYVAHFARTVAKELLTIEEFVFNDQQIDAATGQIRTQAIAGYRCTFSSGKRVEGLSSRPANIRGLQGTVGIDEAAYHEDVRDVLDAVNALLIWGGKIRIISTHNGRLNPFNELIREVRAGGESAPKYSLHFIPFSKAVENGLYERTCLVAGKTPTAEGKVAWEKKIRGSYGKRLAAMHQELDCIPSDALGAVLTRVEIESCMKQREIAVVKWDAPDSLKEAAKPVREAITKLWCDAELKPLLAKLSPDRKHVFGHDFARTGDGSIFVPAEIGTDLIRRVPFVVELRNVPFEQQKQVLFYIGDRLPRMSGGALDATGNGAYLAEVAAQKWGSRIVEVKLSQQWYQVEMTAYAGAFSDHSIELPMHEDVLSDHQAVQWVNGVPMVPSDFRYKGSDGNMRHGDAAVAGCLMYFVSRQDLPVYDGYEGVALPANRMSEGAGTGGGSLFSSNDMFEVDKEFQVRSLRRSDGGF